MIYFENGLHLYSTLLELFLDVFSKDNPLCLLHLQSFVWCEDFSRLIMTEWLLCNAFRCWFLGLAWAKIDVWLEQRGANSASMFSCLSFVLLSILVMMCGCGSVATDSNRFHFEFWVLWLNCNCGLLYKFEWNSFHQNIKSASKKLLGFSSIGGRQWAADSTNEWLICIIVNKWIIITVSLCHSAVPRYLRTSVCYSQGPGPTVQLPGQTAHRPQNKSIYYFIYLFIFQKSHGRGKE